MKFNLILVLLFFISSSQLFAQTTIFTTQVCQTKSNGTLGLDRNQWAHDNSVVNEVYQHDFPPPNVPVPCGDAVINSLEFSINVTSFTDNTDGVTCDFEGIHGNIYVDCPGNCYINQNMNGGCNNFNTGAWGTPGVYTMDLMNCPSTPVPDINSTLSVDVVGSMNWGFSCPCNGTAISTGKVDFEYTVCIDYEYEIPTIPNPTASANGPLCGGETIELMASGGLNYEWDGPGGFSSFDQNPQIFNASDLESGTYNVTVSNAPGCEATASVNVVVAPPIDLSIDNTTDPTCFGLLNGTADVSAIGGADFNYMYNWSPGGASGSSVTNLEGDVTYTITVTDGTGCTGIGDLTLSQPDELQILIDDQGDPICAGDTDGYALLSAIGGDLSYSYTWMPGGFTGDTNFSLEGGIQYQVVVTDGTGCTANEVVELNDPDPVEMNIISALAPLCFGDTTGIAIVEGNGGNGGFSYDWSNGINNDTVSNLLPDSLYYITVSDALGCMTLDSLQVPEADSILLSLANAVDPDCGGTNGSAAVAASGGSGPLSYLWQPIGITDSVATGLTGGIPYTLITTDTNNCTKELVVTLRDAPAFSTTIAAMSNPSCAGTANGSATVNPAGAGFDYEWSNGTTTETVSNLLGDSTYFVTVTDPNGCQVVDSVRLVNPAPLTAMVQNSNNPTCNGFADGSASVQVMGGTGTNYNITWMPGNLSGASVTGLSAGINYTVSITDSQNCPTTANVLLTAPPPVVPSITGDTIFCEGENRILLGNTGFNSYSWSNSTNNPDVVVSNSGTYILTVTDAAGCMGIDSVLVNHYPSNEPQIVGSSSFCTGTSTTLELSGYSSYTWSTGSVDTFIMVNTPGQVTVETIDSNGCTGRDTIQVSESSSLNPAIGGTLSFCAGDSTTLTAGTGFSTYNWSNSLGQNTVNITSPGTYSVTVSDATGCQGSDTVVVVQNMNPTVSISGAMDFCPGDSIQLTADAGFMNYTWNGNSGFQNINIFNSGNYDLEVTDANGCKATTTTSVNLLPVPSVSISGNSSFCQGDTIQLDAGTGLTNYTWSTGSGSQIIDVFAAGDYIVNITANNGCKNADTLAVSANPLPNPSIDNATDFCEGDSIILSVGGGVFSQVVWSDNSQNSTLEIFNSGLYELEVTDANGCKGIASANVNTFSLPNVEISGSSTYCTGNFTTLDAGAGFMNYDWSNGASDQVIMVSQPGLIDVVVTDQNGCTNLDTLTISESASLNPNIVGNLSFCEGDSAVLDAGQGFANYLWSTSENSQTIVVSESGIIDLTVSDNSGCSGTDQVQVTVFQAVAPTNLTPMICTGQFFTVGTNDYSTTGIYRDSFQNINGCDSIVITNLTVSSALQEIVPVQICTGDSLFVGGDFQTQNGTFRDTIQSLGGCDSIVITTLSFAAAIEENIPVEICSGLSYFAAGAMQTEAGTYRDTLQSAGGCDSIAITQLTIAPIPEILSTENLCTGDSILYAGTWRFDTGLYRDTQSIAGTCDTIFTLDLTVEPCQATLAFTITDASCFDEANGSITFSLTSDLNALFVYQIENTDNAASVDNGNILSNTQTIVSNILTAGNYVVRIFDRWGALEAEETFTITQPDQLIGATNIVTAPDCNDSSDGSVSLTGMGGTPNYTFEWSDGFMGDVRDNLGAGTFMVEITDDKNCKSSFDFSLTAPQPIFAEATENDVSCEGKNDGTIEISNLSGGTGTYLYALDGATFSAENLFENLSPGLYDAVVQDANGCEFEIENILVENSSGLNISLPGDLTVIPGEAMVLSPDLDFTPTMIEWTPADNLSCADCLEPTLTISQPATYTITAFVSDDCFAKASINILIDQSGRSTFMPQAFSPNDDGINDVFYVNAGNQVTNVKNFVVVSRWGDIMFKGTDLPPNDPNYGWDGTFRGKKMNSGVYGFFTEVEFSDGSTEIIEGDLTLMTGR